MAQEDQEQTLTGSHCDSAGGGSGGGGGGGGGVNNKPSKNGKPKKVPQRGLGVAQLEKIRLEEQRERDALKLAPGYRFVSVQTPDFDPPPPNSAPFRITNHQLNEGGAEISTEAISSVRNSSNFESNFEFEGKKKQKVDLGFTFHGESLLRNESNSPFLSSLLNLPQRSHHQIQQPSSSVVNASTEINSPSPLISSQTELPSNQILHYSGDHTSSSLEEDKMIGMKRSSPFSLETSPYTFPFVFHPIFAPSKSTSDELLSSNSGHTAKIESINKFVRDGKLNRDFLTLAPPKAASPPPPPPPLNLDQEILRSQVDHTFSFFPDKSNTDETSKSVKNGNGETGEWIDLKLKL